MPPQSKKQFVAWPASSLSARSRRSLHQAVGDELAPGFPVAGVAVRNEMAAAEPGMIEVGAGPIDSDALAVGQPIDIAEPGEARIYDAVRFVNRYADE